MSQGKSKPGPGPLESGSLLELGGLTAELDCSISMQDYR